MFTTALQLYLDGFLVEAGKQADTLTAGDGAWHLLGAAGWLLVAYLTWRIRVLRSHLAARPRRPEAQRMARGLLPARRVGS